MKRQTPLSKVLQLVPGAGWYFWVAASWTRGENFASVWCSGSYEVAGYPGRGGDGGANFEGEI
jgi:hypothetical protein